MAKFTVMFEQPKDVAGFEEYYFNVHVPLAQKLPNMKGASINRVVQTLNSEASLYLLVQIDFENLTDLNAAFESEEGQAVFEDANNLNQFLHNPPVVAISE